MHSEIRQAVLKFRDERDWKQFHNPKDLAISIVLEAAELLEKFQWSGTDLVAEDKLEGLKEELADILIYCELMADALGVDSNQIIIDKLNLNAQKYPVLTSYGSNKKYTDLGGTDDRL